MIRMLPKYTINAIFVQHLSRGSRGFSCRADLWEVVNAILYKLKTGVQWELLPVKSLINSSSIKWGAVYHQYRRWCKDGSWKKVWTHFLANNKSILSMSTVALDGTHSSAKRGGKAVGYQKRKKAKTSNILVLTDSQGLAIAFSKPTSGNHHDLYEIKEQMEEMLSQLKEAGIATDGLFLNADSGFDCAKLVQLLDEEEIMLNTPKNKRNGKCKDHERFFDEEMYEERFVVAAVERREIMLGLIALGHY